MPVAKVEMEEPEIPNAEPVEVEPLEPEVPTISELPPSSVIPEEPPEVAVDEPPALPEPMETLPEADIADVPEEPLPGQEASVSAGGNQAAGTSLLTVGAMALLFLAIGGYIAIQIKNRKAQATMTPPSLEYTQV